MCGSHSFGDETVSLYVIENVVHLSAVTLNNASDYRANGLLSDYIGWTIGLTD